MSLFEKRSNVQQTFPERPIPPFPGAQVYGMSPASVVGNRPDLALTASTVWACVSLLAGAVSSLTLETFRRTSDVPQKIPSPPLVACPAAGQTQSQWLHMTMVSALLRGNAVGRLAQMDEMHRAQQINLLNPDSVTPSLDDSGNLQLKINKTQEVIPPEKVWHMPGMTMPGQVWGLSPISYAANTIGLDISARQFGNDFLGGGGVPKAVLKTTQALTPEQAEGAKSRLMSAFRAREPIVLGAGLDYQMVQVHPEESQFLATMQFNVQQIARFFSIPAEMVGGSSGSSLTYANVEQRSLDFLTYSLAPWLKRIEDALFPLLPQPQYVKFRVEDLLRTDAHTQANVDLLLIAARIKVPSEVRNERSLPPFTDAQEAEAKMVPIIVGPTGRPAPLPGTVLTPGPTAPVPASDEQDPSGGTTA